MTDTIQELRDQMERERVRLQTQIDALERRFDTLNKIVVDHVTSEYHDRPTPAPAGDDAATWEALRDWFWDEKTFWSHLGIGNYEAIVTKAIALGLADPPGSRRVAVTNDLIEAAKNIASLPRSAHVPAYMRNDLDHALTAMQEDDHAQ